VHFTLLLGGEEPRVIGVASFFFCHVVFVVV
jgi:hypothetical protein